MTFRMKN